MEILQFLISFFLKEFGGEKLQTIIDLFQNNSFDLNKIINNLNLETISPIIQEFFKSLNKENTPTDFSVGEDNKLSPIARIADKDIVYTLNRYFC